MKKPEKMVLPPLSFTEEERRFHMVQIQAFHAKVKIVVAILAWIIVIVILSKLLPL